MSSRNERYAFKLAGPEHNRQLLNIYESGEFQGNISVLYTRRPDPYQSLMLEGENAVIPIMIDREEGQVCGMGACVIRKVTLNGRIRTAGYLTGLKSLPEYRKRVPKGAAVYRYLHDITKGQVDIYYTTILEDNIPAQKILEKKRLNMPEYRYRGRYTVYCFKSGAVRGNNSGMKYKGFRFVNTSLSEVKSFFENYSTSFNLSPVEMIWPGITDNNCYAILDDEGRIIAACAVWNQQHYKQYVIVKYRGIYRYLRRIPLQWFGYPDLPTENLPVNYASVTMLTVNGNDVNLAAYFIRKVAEAASSYDFLMLGFFENHPLSVAMNNIRSIKYRSRLYTVHWGENTVVPDERPINIEVGLL